MKTISPFNNTPTIVHVKELPELIEPSFSFGFNPVNNGGIGSIRINVDLMVKKGNTQIKVATYNSYYKIEGEGLVLEEHIYECCRHAIAAMQMFAKYNPIGKSIPPAIFQCPGKEGFEDDLVHLAKFLNAIEGKRNFPMPPQ